MKIDIIVLIMHIKQFFYSLYNEYYKIYGHSLNINVGQSDTTSEVSSSKLINGYQMLFQKTKQKIRGSSSSSSNSELENYSITSFEFVDDDDSDFNILQ